MTNGELRRDLGARYSVNDLTSSFARRTPATHHLLMPANRQHLCESRRPLLVLAQDRELDEIAKFAHSS